MKKISKNFKGKSVDIDAIFSKILREITNKMISNHVMGVTFFYAIHTPVNIKIPHPFISKGIYH